MSGLVLCLVWLLSFGSPQPEVDPRAFYDVQTYRLDLKVDPESRSLSGTVGIAAKVVVDRMETFELDLLQGRQVTAVNVVDRAITPDSSMAGPRASFIHANDRVICQLPQPARKGDEVRVAVTYNFQPSSTERRSGIRFAKTPDGKPWITTSCQSLGAHSWWPCKGENFHPEDKHAHLFVNATVPSGLFAVSNGRLLKRDSTAAGWETFHWRHDYPCEAYAVTLDVAPYVEVNGTVKDPGIAKPVLFSYYVLPQDLEKAKVQFADVQRMVEVYSQAFGPFPYPNSKFGLVQVDFWGMEHSTAVAYGNSWPAWLKTHPGPDPYATFNRLFDYILIHECAHEWWGNAVSAADWGHLWLHEGFATYAEAVYVEKVFGREEADRYMESLRPKVSPVFREFRGTGVLPSQAFSNNVYYKGAWILNTLRTYVNDDRVWWKALREFNMRFRYKNARTEDFQSVVEEVSGQSLQPFFLEWFYGDSYPALKGTVSASGKKIVVDVENPEQHGTGFHVPLDIQWQENGAVRGKRVMLNPGSNRVDIPCQSEPIGMKLISLNRILGSHQVTVEPQK